MILAPLDTSFYILRNIDAVQIGSTLIAALGFAGYTHPKDEWNFYGGQYTQMSDGHAPAFLPSLNNQVPIAGSEGEYTSSVIGCT